MARLQSEVGTKDFRHRANGVGRGGGQAAFNQIPDLPKMLSDDFFLYYDQAIICFTKSSDSPFTR